MYDNNSELIKSAQEGDSAAFDEVIRINMGLVRSIALRFKDRFPDFDDLMQIGTIGMIKAVKSFDFSYNTVFSTYAVPLIIGEIKKFLRDDGIIKVGRDIRKAGITVMKQKEEFLRIYGREPKISELEQKCGMSRDEIIYALEAVLPVQSLSAPLNESQDGKDSLTLEEVISDSVSGIDKATEKMALFSALEKLEPVDREIIKLRYYKELSQQSTAELLGLSQVKISRQEKKILQKLKKAL